MRKISEIEQLDLFTRTGVVVGHQNWAETSVSTSTSGGGGMVYNGTGHIGATTTTVSSRTAEKLRVFIRDDDGAEIEVNFTDPGFGVREGHRVTFVFAKHRDEELGHAMGVVNHSTQVSAVLGNRINWITPEMSSAIGCGLLLLPLLAAGFLGPVVDAILFGKNEGVGYLIVGGAALFFAVRRGKVLAGNGLRAQALARLQDEVRKVAASGGAKSAMISDAAK